MTSYSGEQRERGFVKLFPRVFCLFFSGFVFGWLVDFWLVLSCAVLLLLMIFWLSLFLLS